MSAITLSAMGMPRVVMTGIKLGFGILAVAAGWWGCCSAHLNSNEAGQGIHRVPIRP